MHPIGTGPKRCRRQRQRNQRRLDGRSRRGIRYEFNRKYEPRLGLNPRNRGFSVVQISADDGELILEVRIPMEARALERARERVRETDLQRLSEIKTQLVRLVEDRNTPAREAAEMAFHSYIWDLSGNPWLAMSLKRAMIPYFTFSVYLGIARLDLDARQAEETHQLYLDYLTRKTPLDAVECVRRHLRRD